MLTWQHPLCPWSASVWSGWGGVSCCSRGAGAPPPPSSGPQAPSSPSPPASPCGKIVHNHTANTWNARRQKIKKQCFGSGSGIRDPVPFWPLDPGWVESQHPDPGSRIQDEQPGSYFLELRNHFFGVKILKFFDADPGSGMETVRIRDPGWKKVGSGIRDVYPGSAALQKNSIF